jgi:hypothetical protein
MLSSNHYLPDGQYLAFVGPIPYSRFASMATQYGYKNVHSTRHEKYISHEIIT